MEKDFIITGISRVIFVGEDEYKEKVLRFPKPLEHNELIYYFSGSATVCFNGQTLHRQAGTVNFLPCGSVQEYTVYREKSRCIDIFFDTNVPVSATAFVQNMGGNLAVETLFQKIFSVWVARDEGYYFRCIALLYEILAQMQVQRYIPQKQYLAIKPALAYIQEHFLREKISLKTLTDLCGISESYLKKLFIKRLGIPPLKYIIQLKLNYACDLLKSERYTVAQVAELCGYSNVYFFSRQFKEYMGICPTEFSKAHHTSL